MPEPKYLNRDGTASYLSNVLGRPISKGSLEKLAERGDGPPYRIILGQASYPIEALREWVERSAREPEKRRRPYLSLASIKGRGRKPDGDSGPPPPVAA